MIHVPVAGPVPTPTLARPANRVGMGGMALGLLSESTGWVLVDAGLGGLLGYFIAPPSQRTGYVIGGAVATGLAGVLGAAGVLGYRYLIAPSMAAGESAEEAREYVAVSSSGRVVGGPFKHYDEAKRQADLAGGYVRFAGE